MLKTVIWSNAYVSIPHEIPFYTRKSYSILHSKCGMGKSHNPSGKARETDQAIIDALESALGSTDTDTLAVPARAVSERLSIERPAAKNRLDKLAQTENTGVRRFRGAQAWLYYTAEVAEVTPLKASTPPMAAAESASKGWVGYVDSLTAHVLDIPKSVLTSGRARGSSYWNWPLFGFLIAVAIGWGIFAVVAQYLLLPSSPSLASFVLGGLTGMVVTGTYWLNEQRKWREND